jgi:single-strand DNA-binding protein
MANLNKVLLMGNLTRDPEVRYTASGTAVGNFGIAINDSYKTKDGTIKETVTFVDIEVWGRQAETCKQYLTKGRPVHIEGSLKLDQWDDKTTGAKRSKMSVRADRVQFLGSGNRDGQQGGGRPASGSAPAAAPAGAAPSRPASGDRPPLPDDDDIPF